MIFKKLILNFINFPTAALDSVFYTESSANNYAFNFFQTYSFSFGISHTDS